MIPLVALALAACTDSPISPPMTAARDLTATTAWGPETPNVNLQVVLRGQGFGLVKFRQPNDADAIVILDTWVRDLSPNTSYQLQRAVDPTIDGTCTSNSWLTLGKGLTPATIDTDETGTGSAALFRSLAGLPVGSTFDIHFQVVDATTGAVVLRSDCYQFTISL